MTDPRTAAVRADAAVLAAEHPLLGRAAGLAGDFDIRWRPEGFATAIHLILEQQVSIDAARAMFDRLEGVLGTVEPERFLALDDATLKRCGFSRQKAGYARGLAAAVRSGAFSFEALRHMDDRSATAALIALPGIGPWTAANYLLWALARRDILPPGDLALQSAWGRLRGHDGPASDAEMQEAGEAWRPRRTAASFLLWHAYLASAGRSVPRGSAAGALPSPGIGPVG